MLINPPAILYKRDLPRSTFPLGIAYIASVLELYGYIVKIVDALAEGYFTATEFEEDNQYNIIGLPVPEIINQINSFQPDVVGISSIFSNQTDVLIKLSSEIKISNPNVLIATGGANATYTYDFLLNNSNIDIAFLGEAEISFLQYLEYLNNNFSIENILGIAYKKNDSVVVNRGSNLVGTTNFQGSLDILPFPAWHQLPMETYFKNKAYQSPYTIGQRVAQVITSRGCTAKCTFCSTTNFWGNCFRSRSSENIFRELKKLKDKYNIDEFHIQDDNLTNNIQRSNDILSRLKSLDIPWATPQGLALWKLNKELLDKIKGANAYQITLAIESSSQRVLSKLIRKPLNIEKTHELIAHAKKIGLKVHGFFIIGMPNINDKVGESIEEMYATFSYAKKAGFDSASFFVATPLIGSQLFNEAIRNEFIDFNTPLYKMVYKQGIMSVPNLWNGSDIAKLAEKFNYEFNKQDEREGTIRKWDIDRY